VASRATARRLPKSPATHPAGPAKGKRSAGGLLSTFADGPTGRKVEGVNTPRPSVGLLNRAARPWLGPRYAKPRLACIGGVPSCRNGWKADVARSKIVPLRQATQDALSMTLRSRYEQAVRDLHERVAEMRRDGASTETIARAVHAERRRLAALFKELTPEPYRTRIYERTVRIYGGEDGPSIEFLRAKGKSWEAIIESAKRPGPPIGPPSEQADGQD